MNRIKELRANQGLNMREAARQLHIPYTTYVNYEKGAREPNSEMLIKLANFFNVSIDYLLGRSDSPVDEINHADEIVLSQLVTNHNDILHIRTKKIPLLGEVACGKPIIANSDYEVYVDATTDINADFALKARGDSMINARIFDGDIVFIRKQPDVENGEIAAVIIDDEVTLKRVYKRSDSIMLVAENPKYEPLIYTARDCVNINILGKAIAFQSDVI